MVAPLDRSARGFGVGTTRTWPTTSGCRSPRPAPGRGDTLPVSCTAEVEGWSQPACPPRHPPAPLGASLRLRPPFDYRGGWDRDRAAFPASPSGSRPRPGSAGAKATALPARSFFHRPAGRLAVRPLLTRLPTPRSTSTSGAMWPSPRVELRGYMTVGLGLDDRVVVDRGDLAPALSSRFRTGEMISSRYVESSK